MSKLNQLIGFLEEQLTVSEQHLIILGIIRKL